MRLEKTEVNTGIDVVEKYKSYKKSVLNMINEQFVLPKMRRR